MGLSRRELLKLGIVGSAALYLPVERIARAAVASEPDARCPSPSPSRSSSRRRSTCGPRPTAEARHEPRADHAPGRGPSSAQPRTGRRRTCGPTTGPDGEINPTIHVDKGQPIEITHVNGLPPRHPQHGYESWTSAHLHGSASLPQYDGYATDVIKPGQRKVYQYPNMQGARTLWYHDHGVHRTAKNAYSGLAAQYHLHDDMERAPGSRPGPSTSR